MRRAELAAQVTEESEHLTRILKTEGLAGCAAYIGAPQSTARQVLRDVGELRRLCTRLASDFKLTSPTDYVP